jgi:catechol 2,3-dioxygenase-like lactoylglutathione lyase family enzyme
MTDDPARCIPVPASLDLDESQDFYVRQLGFRADYHDEHKYLIVKRDEMEIHFWLTNDRRFPENTSCYVRGGQIGALYQEFRSRGVKRLSEFTVMPWNMKEFHLIDPHRNLLRFGCIPEEA